MSRFRGVEGAARPVTFGSLFRHREFAVLWLAGSQSSVGDQLARVAVSVLVYRSTGSELATAATYALTYLPALVGGVVLSTLADRYPRRELLIVCDLIRVVLFGLMALPGLPLAALYSLLAVGVLAGSPYKAAEPAVLAEIFDRERYSTAVGLRSATLQFAQLLGFGIGGAVTAAVGPSVTLLIDAATFVVSAMLLAIGLTSRPAAMTGMKGGGWRQIGEGVRVVAGSPRLRVLLGLSWLAGWWVIPEGLAVPYADAHGGGATAAGLLLAANPAGTLVGAVVMSRLVPVAVRPRTIGPLAAAAGLPLIACATDPGVVGAGLLWAACGALTSYLVVVMPEFVTATPLEVRGRAIGLASAGLLAAQGIGLLIGGAIATAWSVVAAVTLAGALGVVSGVPLALAWSGRSRAPRTGGHRPGAEAVDAA